MKRLMGTLRSQLLARAVAGGEWTVSGLAEAVCRSSDLCRPHVVQLEKFGWLRKIRDAHNSGGGKKIGVYVWTGKAVPSVADAIDDQDCAEVVMQCFTAMVRSARSSSDFADRLCAAVTLHPEPTK